MSFPGAAKVKVTPGPIVKVQIMRTKHIYSRADVEDIEEGSDEVEVEFTTPLIGTNWVLAGLSIVNHTDDPNLTPTFSLKGISAPSQSGFTVKLSAPAPPGTNYKLHWAIAEVFNP
jgi:hypothetical protein